MTAAKDPVRPIAARRILITGGNGFVGRHLIAALTAQSAPGCRIAIAGREEECDLFLDLADAATVDAAVRGYRPDLLLHLAGEASVAGAAKSAAATWQINLVGTLALARAFAEVAPTGTFFFTSSAEVYGDAFRSGEAREDGPAVPNSVYGRTKLAAEQMLADVLPAELRLIVVRPSNHVGPGQDERFALPSFARQLAEGERAGGPIAISVGNLEAERDFMDVRDVVRAYLALLANAESRGVYNIASGSVRPVRELLDMMRSAARVETRVEVDPDRQRAVDIPVAAVNADRIRAETGWKPCFAMERTLADLLADVRARQAPQPIG